MTKSHIELLEEECKPKTIKIEEFNTEELWLLRDLLSGELARLYDRLKQINNPDLKNSYYLMIKQYNDLSLKITNYLYFSKHSFKELIK